MTKKTPPSAHKKITISTSVQRTQGRWPIAKPTGKREQPTWRGRQNGNLRGRTSRDRTLPEITPFSTDQPQPSSPLVRTCPACGYTFSYPDDAGRCPECHAPLSG
jgi:hypothetical protein